MKLVIVYLLEGYIVSNLMPIVFHVVFVNIPSNVLCEHSLQCPTRVHSFQGWQAFDLDYNIKCIFFELDLHKKACAGCE